MRYALLCFNVTAFDDFFRLSLKFRDFWQNCPKLVETPGLIIYETFFQYFFLSKIQRFLITFSTSSLRTIPGLTFILQKKLLLAPGHSHGSELTDAPTPVPIESELALAL